MSEEQDQENSTAHVDQGEGESFGREVAEASPVAEEELESVEDEEGAREQVELAPLLEALLFVSGEPLGFERLMEITRADEVALREALATITAKFAPGGSSVGGFELVKVADKYQFRSRAIFGPYIRELKAERPRRLSAAALETLAVVAYRQPVVKSDIERIRGVDVTPTLKTLLERSLVKIVGHQPTVGQPALYGTTEEFLKLFGLNSLAQLPSLRDLKELERDPGESEEEGATEASEPVAEAAPQEAAPQSES